MTTAVRRHLTRGLFAAVVLALRARTGWAYNVDDAGEMQLRLRAYTAVRIGTERIGGSDNPLSFPSSPAGHVRQDRYFLQLDFDHDISRIGQEGWGPARILGLIDNLLDMTGWHGKTTSRYKLEYRGEWEGIYDYGPGEYSDPGNVLRKFRLNVPNVSIPGLVSLSRTLPPAYINQRVHFLRDIARQRQRLFTAYLDWERGPVFFRIGRQVLAWGETDVFRLLDNINPLDDSFGGFFIALDERRLPLEMARGSYQLGDVGPLQDAFLEGFAATGSRVATDPGIPNGSPWAPGGIASPNPQIVTQVRNPATSDIRGGARFVFTWAGATTTLAHYYTYLDVPGVSFRLPGPKQCAGETSATDTARFCNPIVAYQNFPRVQISGLSTTFPVPAWYTIIRSEVAYFRGEPMNRQGQGDANDTLAAKGTPGFNRLVAENNTDGGLNPFVYPRFIDPFNLRKGPIFGNVLKLDTFNVAVGADVNRFVRWLNPTQTFFFSTQFFYKHVFNSPGDLILPVPARNIAVGSETPLVGDPNDPNNQFGFLGGGCGGPKNKHACPLQPRFYHLADNRFLQTLLVTTSYSGGRIVPSYGMFYDWQGAMVFQPGVQFVHDPWRVIFDYTRIEGAMTGQFGAVRDKDNVRFQFEFVF
jgi:hypothetical protein